MARIRAKSSHRRATWTINPDLMRRRHALDFWKSGDDEGGDLRARVEGRADPGSAAARAARLCRAPQDDQYNHLVANVLIFHTAIGMTRALDGIAADGFGDAVSPEGLATLSPYQIEHINRFGDTCSICRCRPRRCRSRCRSADRRGVRQLKPSML